MRVSDEEREAFNFFTDDEAAQLLRPHVWGRTALALDAARTGRTHYAHYGSDELGAT